MIYPLSACFVIGDMKTLTLKIIILNGTHREWLFFKITTTFIIEQEK